MSWTRLVVRFPPVVSLSVLLSALTVFSLLRYPLCGSSLPQLGVPVALRHEALQFMDIELLLFHFRHSMHAVEACYRWHILCECQCPPSINTICPFPPETT